LRRLLIFAARPGKVDHEDAKREEILVPIRLEFDVEHHRMREAFVWNLNGGYFTVTLGCFHKLMAVKDPVITPEIFAQSLVDDYALAPSYLSTG